MSGGTFIAGLSLISILAVSAIIENTAMLGGIFIAGLSLISILAVSAMIIKPKLFGCD